MKKIVLFMMISLSFLGCGKTDNDTIDLKVLDIKGLADLLNRSVGEVKTRYKANLTSEIINIEYTKLSYVQQTEEKEYLVSFSFYANKTLGSIAISTSGTMNQSDGINFTKKISDRINNIYSEKTWVSVLTGTQNRFIKYNGRNEF